MENGRGRFDGLMLDREVSRLASTGLHLLIGFDCVKVKNGMRLTTLGGVGPLLVVKGAPAADPGILSFCRLIARTVIAFDLCAIRVGTTGLAVNAHHPVTLQSDTGFLFFDSDDNGAVTAAGQLSGTAAPSPTPPRPQAIPAGRA